MAGIESTVLVVDDDESVLHSLRLLLESAGYGSAGFGSAEELIESGLVGRACCLILDIQLPGMSGFELQELLTALHTTIPVIFITAHDLPGIEERALSLGARAFLRKPFDGRAILDAIRPVCKKGGGGTTP
jgi:FixJ family two-component response regulator